MLAMSLPVTALRACADMSAVQLPASARQLTVVLCWVVLTVKALHHNAHSLE